MSGVDNTEIVQQNENSNEALLGFRQGKLKRNVLPLPDAIHFYGSVMSIYHGFYIAQAETEALYIVDIAGMSPVKFFKNTVNRFLIHADTVVFYFYSQLVTCCLGIDLYAEIIL